MWSIRRPIVLPLSITAHGSVDRRSDATCPARVIDRSNHTDLVMSVETSNIGTNERLPSLSVNNRCNIVRVCLRRLTAMPSPARSFAGPRILIPRWPSCSSHGRCLRAWVGDNLARSHPARWCHDAPQRTILTALDGERASGSWCAAGAPNRPRATSSARSTPFPCSISSTRSPSSTRVSVTRPPVRGRVRITAARKHQRPVGQGAPVVDVADVVEVRRHGHRFLVDADARRARHRLRVSNQPMNTQLSVVADALMLADVKHV